MGMMDRPTTWQMAGATALLSIPAAAVPHSETLAVATGLAAASILLNPVRRWINSYVDRVPLLGVATRNTFNTAVAGAVLATGINALADGGTLDQGMNIIDGTQVAALETFNNTVTPVWQTLDSWGDTIKTPAAIALNAVGAPLIEDGVAARTIDLVERDIGTFIHQAISPFEDIERPESFDILD